MKNKKKKHNSQNRPAELFLYGTHACLAASLNPKRTLKEILYTKDSEAAPTIQNQHPSIPARELSVADMAQLVPSHAPHQGIVLRVLPLPEISLSELLDTTPEHSTLLLLDQITDPQNVGAILRSAALFGVQAILVPKHSSPKETPTMAKIASGALDVVPMITVTNLGQAIKQLKKEGFWSIGLDQDATMALTAIPQYERKMIVLGSEGKGMRPLVKEQCDIVTAIPTISHPTIDSLNVSNAAAITLYALSAPPAS